MTYILYIFEQDLVTFQLYRLVVEQMGFSEQIDKTSVIHVSPVTF